MGRFWTFVAAGTVILLLALLFGGAYPRTEYAPGYSDGGFKRVKVGMPVKQVYELIGAPLMDLGSWAMQTNAYDVFWYSHDATVRPFDVGWHQRIVVVSNNVVIAKVKCFKFEPSWNRSRKSCADYGW